MATLTNTKIKDTYDGLLKTTDNEALDVSGVTLIEDGLGNASALSVGRSGNGVSVSGNLAVGGTGVFTNTLRTDNILTVGDSTTVGTKLIQVTPTSTSTPANIQGIHAGVGAYDITLQTSGGNVGIGGSPITKFTLEGVRNTNTLTLRSTSNDSAWSSGDEFGAIEFYSNDASGGGVGVKSAISCVTTASSGSTSELTFSTSSTGTNNVERMRIDSIGNVGIGVTPSGAKFHIVSTNSTAKFESSTTGLFNTYKNSNGDFAYVGTGSQTVSGGSANDLGIQAVNNFVIATGGNTERMRILSSGGITFNGDTSSANALDDYEEGTWTAEIADAGTGGNTASIGTQSCKYTKIGNQVFVTALIGNINTSGMTGGNPLFVRGLPYQALESSYGTVVLDGFTFTGNYCVFAVSSLGLYGTLSQITSNDNDGALLVSAVNSSASDILFSATYRV